MAEREVVERMEHRIKDTSDAQVIPISPAKRRMAGFRKAQRLTWNAEQTESVIFRSILSNVFQSENVVQSLYGTNVLVGRADSDETAITRVYAERIEDKTRFTVVTNPDEYEWLTVNLGETNWREAERDAGKILGRYYRLTNLTAHVLETTGEVAMDDPAFGRMHPECVAPAVIKACTEQEKYDIAVKRLAGAHVLGAMALSVDEEDGLRSYLTYSINDRFNYAVNLLNFASVSGGQLPPDAGRDMAHWKGICNPLDAENLTDLWRVTQV